MSLFPCAGAGLAAALLLLGAGCESRAGRARALAEEGRFREAIELAEGTYEAERLRRVRKDYTLTRGKLLEELKRRVRDFRPAELDAWEADGRLDWRVIDGGKRYFRPSVSNLFFRYADVRRRKLDPGSARRKLDLVRRLRERASETYFDPARYRVTMTVTVDEGVVPEGEPVRCWLPFPRECGAQRDVGLVSSSPPHKSLDGPDAPMRAIFFEAPAREFRVVYEFTRYNTLFRLDPSKVREAPFRIGEQEPHVVFSPRIRDLAERITEGEPNPMLRARKIYDWCAANIRYSFAHEYSTIPNIPEFCLERGYGDCGQIGLLFIALCRASGVPARWQTGWRVSKTYCGLHDWTQIYLEPYGWVPADPMEAQWMLHSDDLDAAEKREVADFYFGGMDARRMAANRDHGAPLTPAKKFWRSDTVDFQRGELEWSGGNLFYDQFDYDLAAEVLSPN